jgi:hypothetical protein
MQSRRDLIQTIGATTASALVGTPVVHAGPKDGDQFAAPWWLLAPLQPLERLENRWVLDSLSTIKDGASVLKLSRGSETVRIHICLHDDAPRGPAYSELFDLIVMDHGRGVRPVPEDLSPTLLLLSDIIRENEWNDVPDRQLDGINRMMTHAERVRAFGPSHLQ